MDHLHAGILIGTLYIEAHILAVIFSLNSTSTGLLLVIMRRSLMPFPAWLLDFSLNKLYIITYW